MRTQTKKLNELQQQLKKIIKDVENGKLTNAEAAEKITELREMMDEIIKFAKG
jgi:hypothetical protein